METRQRARFVGMCRRAEVTLAQIARHADLSLASVSRYAYGLRRPTFDNLWRLAAAMRAHGISTPGAVHELLVLEDAPPRL
jgi:transcriptional regulator with XRE-family HTH domain